MKEFQNKELKKRFRWISFTRFGNYKRCFYYRVLTVKDQFNRVIIFYYE